MRHNVTINPRNTLLAVRSPVVIEPEVDEVASSSDEADEEESEPESEAEEE